jgi:hypothetical protein
MPCQGCWERPRWGPPLEDTSPRGVGLSWNWDGQIPDEAHVETFCIDSSTFLQIHTMDPFCTFAISPLVGVATKDSIGNVWSNSKNGGGAILCIRDSLYA